MRKARITPSGKVHALFPPSVLTGRILCDPERTGYAKHCRIEECSGEVTCRWCLSALADLGVVLPALT